VKLGKWDLARIREWYKTQFPIFGCNYVPSFAVNSTEMWQCFDELTEETVRSELTLAAATSMNSVRVFLQFIVWEHDPDEFKKRFDRFLHLASGCGLSVMPILFDDCAFSGKEPYPGPQNPPVPGVHNSGWTASPGFTRADDPEHLPKLQAYVLDVVGSFKDDERIVVWDMYNEPGNSDRGDRSMPLLRAAFKWSRDANPSQPLTAGCWSWENPLFGVEIAALELSDIVSFHSYNDVSVTTRQIEMLQGFNRPLLCTEWLHRPNNNHVSSHLPLFKDYKIGIYNWGLVQGRTQTNLSWSTMNGEPDPDPVIWQHDFYTPEHIPYCADEIVLLKSFTEV